MSRKSVPAPSSGSASTSAIESPLTRTFRVSRWKPVPSQASQTTCDRCEVAERHASLADAVARLAAPARDVAAEPRRRPSAGARLERRGEEPAQRRQHGEDAARRRAGVARRRAPGHAQPVDRRPAPRQASSRSVGNGARSRTLRTTGASTSSRSVLLPAPLTPVTQVRPWSGNDASTPSQVVTPSRPRSRSARPGGAAARAAAAAPRGSRPPSPRPGTRGRSARRRPRSRVRPPRPRRVRARPRGPPRGARRRRAPRR